jgi:hypothetical protein
MPALLLLCGCEGREVHLPPRDKADLAPVQIAVQEGLGLLDCSRAAIPLQAGYAEQEQRFQALIIRADQLGLKQELKRWQLDYRAAMAVADVACFPRRLADDLKRVNDRLEAALKEVR